MARRKRLLSLDLLEKGNALLDMGVPMTSVHKQLGLEKAWSYQSTADVFTADRQDLHSVTRPSWLKESSEDLGIPVLQSTPVDWKFEGTFPYGEWIKLSTGTTKTKEV